MSTYRYDDSRSTISSSRRDRDGPSQGTTTVRRYIIKDDDSQSRVSDRRSYVAERSRERPAERVETTTRILRRDVDDRDTLPLPLPRDDRQSTEQIVIRRDLRDDDRRSLAPVAPLPPQRDDRDEIVIRRTKDISDADLAVARVDDRRDTTTTQVVRRDYRDDYDDRDRDRDRDLAYYTRQTDYYSPVLSPPPQTIIIKQEPIIIRERVRDDEERTVVRRQRSPEQSPSPSPPRRSQENFYYEKKVKERIEEPRGERRLIRREVSPGDSVSQVGRRSRRDSYSSDDSLVYVKRTTTKDDDVSDDDRRDRNRNLAAGALAGVGAAEILRSHSKKRGKETSHGLGRVGRDVGAGALGALAAEGISRARRSFSRARDKAESDDDDDDDRDLDRKRDHRSRRHRSKSRARSRARSESDSSRRRRRRSRTRSESRSKLKTWGAVGLGAAALAAAAAIAQRKLAENKEEREPARGRSQSRRRHTNESVDELANDPGAPSSDARNPRHRNLRMAEAGAAGAAITALIDHARSKSRGGRDRSRSRIRQAVPIVAAGLGTAAVAGIYEKNKAKKEAEEIAQLERRSARRSSHSRSRQGSEYSYSDYGRESQGHAGHNNALPATASPMIEYGDGPMYGNNYGREYYPGGVVDQYGQPPSQEPYYASQTAVVPATANHRVREVDTERRSRSRSSSPEGYRRRHRHSRSRSGAREAIAAAAGLAAGAGAATFAAHEHEKHEQQDQNRTRRRSRRARKDRDQYADQYDDSTNTNNYNQPYAPVPAAGPAAGPAAPSTAAAEAQQAYYPQTSQFPPPPGPNPAPQYTSQPTAQPLNQAAYTTAAAPQSTQPPTSAAQAGYHDAYASGANPYAPYRGGDENVSQPGVSATRDLGRDVGVSDPVPAATAPAAGAPAGPGSSNLLSASYVPPTERPVSPPASTTAQLSPARAPAQRAVSQPPPSSSSRKSVQFAERPDVQPVETESAEDTEASSPGATRRHRERGYEAGDDTDSSYNNNSDNNNSNNNAQQRRPRDRDRDRDREIDNSRRHHRRRSSHEPPSSSSRRGGTTDPDANDSDGTVDLPPRFDNKGNRTSDSEHSLLPDRIDDIIQGKGVAGKLFGNMVEGIFGPEGRKKKSY